MNGKIQNTITPEKTLDQSKRERHLTRISCPQEKAQPKSKHPGVILHKLKTVAVHLVAVTLCYCCTLEILQTAVHISVFLLLYAGCSGTADGCISSAKSCAEAASERRPARSSTTLYVPLARPGWDSARGWGQKRIQARPLFLLVRTSTTYCSSNIDTYSVLMRELPWTQSTAGFTVHREHATNTSCR